MHGCAVSERYIDVCNCDMFSVVNVYLDHLKFCVSVVVNVMLSLMSVMSPPHALSNILMRTVVKLCTLGVLDLGGELGFLNCDDICMCVLNKQFELLEFVCDSLNVDLQTYDEISLTFTAASVCLCGVCSPVVVTGLSVWLSWYPIL